MSDARVDNLIDEGGGKFFLRTCLVEIMEISAYSNDFLFLVAWDRIGNP